MATERRTFDPELDDPELTAQPTVRRDPEPDDEKVVPDSNVGGAAPTRGLDSGGDLPGSEDDLSNLFETEPSRPPEVRALHVEDEEAERKASEEE